METIEYPSGIQETRLEVTGNVVFKKRLDQGYDIIHGYKDDPYNINWWLSLASDPAKLDVPILWKLELLEQRGGVRDRLGWGKLTEVLRFSLQGKTVFDASLCEVHHLPMERVVETKDEFGGRRMPDSFGHAKLTQFPNSGTDFPVCTFWENSNITWRCSKCLSSSKKWCRKYAADAPWL